MSRYDVRTRQLEVPLMVVVRQPENGNSQADNPHRSQKHHDENERPIHLMQMQQNRIAVLVQVLQAGVVAGPKADRRQPEPNHGAGDDDGSAKWSHGFLHEFEAME